MHENFLDYQSTVMASLQPIFQAQFDHITNHFTLVHDQLVDIINTLWLVVNHNTNASVDEHQRL